MSAARAPVKASGGVRKDPALRSLDTLDSWTELENVDRDHHYVWVNKLTREGPSVSFYRSRGYQVVKFTKGGVRPRGNEDLREGEPIEELDVVLMACSKERKDEIDRAGQARADAFNAKIQRRGRTMENLQGISGLMGADGAPVIYEEDHGTSGEVLVHGG